jgi:hypothetical protein
MSLADRIAQLSKPRLNLQRGERRGCIHRSGCGLLPTAIVSRGGAYTGGKV